MDNTNASRNTNQNVCENTKGNAVTHETTETQENTIRNKFSLDNAVADVSSVDISSHPSTGVDDARGDSHADGVVVRVEKAKKKVFRFKFRDDTLGPIIHFANVHRFDDRITFKDAWKEWAENNKKLIESETAYLENLGYEGNVEQKMFRSARYYFKNKSREQVQAKERRPYIRVNPDILEKMDQHIFRNSAVETFTPALGFDGFMNLFEESIGQEQQRIVGDVDGFTEEDFIHKMKKTYKNRYFIYAGRDE